MNIIVLATWDTRSEKAAVKIDRVCLHWLQMDVQPGRHRALAGSFRPRHRAGGSFPATLVSDAGTLTHRSAADRLLAGRANRRAGHGHDARRATHCPDRLAALPRRYLPP